MTAPTSTLRDKVLDALERAGSAAAEQFLAIVSVGVAATSLAGLPWAVALSTSAGAAIVSLLLTVVQYAVNAGSLSFAADVAVRVIKSFAASLLATIGADVTFNVVDFTWVNALNVAGVAAVLTLVKCLLSPNAHLSGSLLPTPTVARLQGVETPAGAFKPAA